MTILPASIPVIVVLLAGVPSVAPAQPEAPLEGLPRRVVSHTLEVQDLGLVGLGQTGPVTLIDGARVLVPGVLAVFAPASQPLAAPTEPWRLELIDGQVLIGRPRESVPSETLIWELADGTALTVPIDLVLRLAEASSPAMAFVARPEARDAVLTMGGDRLQGFVSGLGSGVIIETDAGVFAVELSQVREVRLASEPEPPSEPLIWLEDGTVLAARLTGLGEGVRLEFEPVLEVATRSRLGLTRMLGEVRGVNFAPARLRPLAALGMPRVTPSAGRRWTPAPEFLAPDVLGLSSITLPGPMGLSWDLPPGASLLSLRVELAPEARRWGDCVLRIETDVPSASARAELRLSADTPSGELRVDLSGAAELRLTLLPGERGPIQDRITISEAMLLFEHEGS